MKPEKIFAFDDGSIESKVMQHELKNTYDIQPIKVEKYEDLPTWLDKAIKYTEGAFTGIIKIFLHFPFEDYIQKDIRTVIQEAERKNPKLRIIPWYEQAHRQGLQNRAANYGITTTTEIYDKTLLNKDVVEKEDKPEVLDMSPKAIEEMTKGWKEIKLSEPTYEFSIGKSNKAKIKKIK